LLKILNKLLLLLLSKRILCRLFSLVINFNYFLWFNTFGYVRVYILCAFVCALLSVSWFLSCFSVNLINLLPLLPSHGNLRAAWTQQRTKEKRYRVAAAEAGMILHGLAIEVYGRWGDDFSHMFNHFISLGAAHTNIPRAILAKYWRRRIFVCLQSGVASAINTRSNRLTARSLGAGRRAALQPRGSIFSWPNRGAIGGVSRRSSHWSGL
jgi:hypothetical protein